MLDLKQKSLAMKLLGPGGAVLGLAIDADRQYVAAIVQRRDFQGQGFQGWVLLWNLANPEKPATRQLDHLPRAIAFRPGAKLLAMGFAREVRTLNLESLADGPTIATSSDVHFLKFSPDGVLLAVNDTLVDAATGEKLSDIRGRVVAFDAENRILAIPGIHGPSGAQYPLHRYAANGREHQTLIADLGSNSIAAALAPGGRLFAIADLVRGAGPEGINVWDLETGKLLERLPGHADSIGALAFSDDGKRLASIGRLGGIIRHWPVARPPEAAPQ